MTTIKTQKITYTPTLRKARIGSKLNPYMKAFIEDNKAEPYWFKNDIFQSDKANDMQYRYISMVRLNSNKMLCFVNELRNPFTFTDIENAIIKQFVLDYDPETSTLTISNYHTILEYSSITCIDDPSYFAFATSMTARKINSGVHAGRIVLLFATNKDVVSLSTTNYLVGTGSYNVYKIYSDDDGITWSSPEIMQSIYNSGISKFNPAGGTILEIKYGVNKGRLVVPCYDITTPTQYFFTIYSDDGGDNWTASDIIYTYGLNEAKLVEDIYGTIYASARLNTNTGGSHHLLKSIDGVTWDVEELYWQNVNLCNVEFLNPAINGNVLPKILYSTPSISSRAKGIINLYYTKFPETEYSRLVNYGRTHFGYSYMESLNDDGMLIMLYETDCHKPSTNDLIVLDGKTIGCLIFNAKSIMQ